MFQNRHLGVFFGGGVLKKMAFLEALKTLVIELRMHQNAFLNATILKIFLGRMPPDHPRFQRILERAISSPDVKR